MIVLLFTHFDRLLSPPVISGDCVTVYPFWPPTVILCYKWRLCYCLPFLTAYCHPLILVEIVLLLTLSDLLLSSPVISGECVTSYPFWPPIVTPCYKWRLCYFLPFLTAYCHLMLYVEIALLFTLSDRLLSPPVISGDCGTVYPFWPPTDTSCYKGRLCYYLPFLTAYCHPLLQVEIVLMFTLSDRLLSPPVISGQCVTVYPFWAPTATPCYRWRLCYCLPILTAFCHPLL